MGNATVSGNDALTLDLEELLNAQESLRAHIKALTTRLESMHVRVETAEAAAAEAAGLRRQVHALNARLEQERAAHAAESTSSDPDADKRLREVYEELRSEYMEVAVERDQLEHICGALEARLQEAEETHAVEVADLKAERDGWLTIAEELEQELAREREGRKELEELAEASMSAEENLRQMLQQTQRELNEARQRRDELQALMDSRKASSAHGPTGVPSSMSTTLRP